MNTKKAAAKPVVKSDSRLEVIEAKLAANTESIKTLIAFLQTNLPALSNSDPSELQRAVNILK